MHADLCSLPVGGVLSTDVLTITPGSENAALTIVNGEDALLEGSQTLLAVIQTTHPVIDIGPNITLNVTIEDNDGKSFFGSFTNW